MRLRMACGSICVYANCLWALIAARNSGDTKLDDEEEPEETGATSDAPPHTPCDVCERHTRPSPDPCDWICAMSMFIGLGACMGALRDCLSDVVTRGVFALSETLLGLTVSVVSFLSAMLTSATPPLGGTIGSALGAAAMREDGS